MPALIQLLRADPDFPRLRLAILLTLSAIAGGGFLIALNVAIDEIAASQPNPQTWLVLMLLLLLSIITQYYALAQMGVSLEDSVLKKRLLVVARLRYADPGYIEAVLDAPSRAILVKDSQIISQAMIPAILLIRSLAILIFVLVYLVALSPVFSLVILLTVSLYLLLERRFIQPRLAARLGTTWASHQVFFHHVQGLLDNMRNIRQYRHSGDEALSQFRQLATGMSQEKRAINQVIAIEFTLGAILFQVMLLSLLVFVPGLIGGWGADTLKLAVATLYLMLELMAMPTHWPILARANAAVEEMNRLEGVIRKSPRFESPGRPAQDSYTGFSSLQLNQLHFRYPDGDSLRSFELGPLNLSLASGEWLCLSGASGSGKSTLLKILAGLETRFTGSYCIDGKELEPDDYPLMRELFAVAWSEGPRVTSLTLDDPRQMPPWLDKLDLAGRVRHVEGRWDVGSGLSTAEMRRVRLLKAIVEDRPVLLLDDLLSDQDAEWRERLYLEILPALIRQGKTVVIVSRDETCHELADRTLTLNNGSFKG